MSINGSVNGSLECDAIIRAALTNEIVQKIEKMSKLSAGKPAHEEVKLSAEVGKTGIKGLDNLSRILSAK